MLRNYQQALQQRGADLVRVVDLSALPREQTLGYPAGIIFLLPLSRGFVRDMALEVPTSDEYLQKEAQVEALADWLADLLRGDGWRAHSQSERNNINCGYTEIGFIQDDLVAGPSILPQKALARMAGMGFIGKNNLLVTKEYGCAAAVCSVLTDAPLQPDPAKAVTGRCGSCTACVDICPGGALRGNNWSLTGGREALLDISKCCCALKCMVHCPWTKRYADALTVTSF